MTSWFRVLLALALAGCAADPVPDDVDDPGYCPVAAAEGGCPEAPEPVSLHVVTDEGGGPPCAHGARCLDPNTPAARRER
jgi:hypothetical protein